MSIIPTSTAMPSTEDEIQQASSEFKVQARAVEMLFPLDDRLVVKPAAAPELTDSGLHIPDVAQQRPARGVVVAVGAKVTDVHPGQVVLYGHFTGSEAEHMGQEVLMMRRADVYAVIRLATLFPDGTMSVADDTKW